MGSKDICGWEKMGDWGAVYRGRDKSEVKTQSSQCPEQRAGTN
jgi:hypothetical protein